MHTLYLSIIIPAHNEQNRLPISLEKIDKFLQEQSYSYEVIIVENGSSDKTIEIVKEEQEKYPYLRLITASKRGKGLAVKIGILEAKGQYRFIADADLSMPIEEIEKFLPPKLEVCEVAIGSREVKGAERINEPSYRHMIGRIFNILIRFLALPGIKDTQCGFKCFRADVAETVFPLQTLDGMSFDVEVLYIARRLGFTIKEVPINWHFNSDSRVRLIKDSFQMGFDLLSIRHNARKDIYHPN